MPNLTIEQELEASRAEVARLQGELATAQASVTEFQTQAANLASVQTQLSEATAQLATVRGELATAQGQVQTLTARNATLEAAEQDIETRASQRALVIVAAQGVPPVVASANNNPGAKPAGALSEQLAELKTPEERSAFRRANFEGLAKEAFGNK